MLLKINQQFYKKIFIFTLFIADIIAIIFGFLASYYLRNEGIFRLFLDPIQPMKVYLQALPAAVFFLLIIFTLSGLYEPKKRITKISETYTVLRMITLWIILIMAGSYLYKYNYSRIIVIQLYLYTSIFVIIGRLIVRNLHLRFISNGIGKTNICIVGTGNKARKIAERIANYKLAGYNLVGFLDNLNSLDKFISENKIEEVYIAKPSLSQKEILNFIAKCKNQNVKFKIASNIFDLIAGNIDISNLESIPSIDLKKANFSTWKRLYKRVFDLIFGIIFLIISLPLLFIIVFIIKFTSYGPAIFTQERVGLNGKKFKIYKFRTMLWSTSAYKRSPKNIDDDRITKIGKFLRKTSLDELPQLINILKGEMSFVGPRPEMAFIVEKYNLWEKRRLSVKPGLTGLWQILGRKDLPLSENLEYDFYYINNQSFILDLVILLKTIPIVITFKGAY